MFQDRTSVNWAVKVALAMAALCAGLPAHVQDALDVTAPAQIEDRDDFRAPVEEALRIEFQPVLEMPSVSQDQQPIAVSAVAIDGLVALTRADFADVIEVYAGRTLSHEDLSMLTAAIADRARDSGYLFANAWVR